MGTQGDNHLASTSGNDLFRGNGGHDTFEFAANFGQDVISDFAVSGGKVYLWEVEVSPVIGTRPVVRRALEGTLEGSFACQQSGARLFFSDGAGCLMRFDTAAGSVDRFDSTPVRSFAVSGD